MTDLRSDQRFADEVMARLERQERRLPRVLAALAVAALVLAVPAVVALRARPALEAGARLGVLGLREMVSAMLDNPAFWVVVAVAAAWLGWLAWAGVRGRR
jgi:low temperature requirement protein LtrA